MKWHYTTHPRLRHIVASGVLRPNSYEGERAAVWFSSNQQFEQTARKRVNNMRRRLTFDEMAALLGLARIGVESGTLLLLTFDEWAECIEPEFATSLALGGCELGAEPTEWYASLDPVPRSEWRSIQIWQDNQWKGIEDLI